jgi:Flp pilus assembly protein TadG
VWRRDDRGGVAVTVAVLISGGVLLGFAALVVDVGQIYVERSELQSSADAAAMAVAKACSIREPDCTSWSRARVLARRYANANSGDGVTRVVELCGRLRQSLNPCDPSRGNLTDCLGSAPPAPATYVEVRVATALPGNRFALPPTFAQAMAGNAGFDGASVGACARASWDQAETAPVLAMTISTCEYEDAPGDRTYVIQFRDGDHEGCGVNPPGPWREVGPARWLAGSSGCMITDPGPIVRSTARPPSACADEFDDLIDGGRAWIPVHDARLTSRYRIVGVIEVEVTGYYFGGEDGGDDPRQSDPPPCAADDDHTCVGVVVTGPMRSLSSLTGGPLVRLIG